MSKNQRVIVSSPHELNEECDVSSDDASTFETGRDFQNVLLKKGIACCNVAWQTLNSSEFDSTNSGNPFDLIITDSLKALSRSYIQDMNSKAEENEGTLRDRIIAPSKMGFFVL